MISNLIVFNNNFEGINVEIITDENGNPLFEIYTTGMALGYTKEAKGKKYAQKDRIEKIIANAGISAVVHGVQQYLNEEMLYDFMLEARTEKCKSFRKWVTSEVLPSINRNGAYISPNITPIQEEKLDKYSTNKKIKNTFKFCNIESIEAEFKECMIYHKNKDGKEKSSIQNNVINALSDRKQALIDSGKGTFALVLAEVITVIGKKQLETNNKSKSQIISHKNKVIDKQGRLIFEQDEIIREKQNQIDFLDPNIEEFTMVKKHPFSTNYMTKTIIDDYGKLRTVTSDEYRNWQNSFPNYAISNEDHIDWNKKIYLWLRFDALERFDADNMIKSFQDQLARFYGANDGNVQIREATINKVVKSYGEGRIYYIIKNV